MDRKSIDSIIKLSSVVKMRIHLFCKKQCTFEKEQNNNKMNSSQAVDNFEYQYWEGNSILSNFYANVLSLMFGIFYFVQRISRLCVQRCLWIQHSNVILVFAQCKCQARIHVYIRSENTTRCDLQIQITVAACSIQQLRKSILKSLLKEAKGTTQYPTISCCFGSIKTQYQH